MVVDTIATNETTAGIVISKMSAINIKDMMLWSTKDLNFYAYNKDNETALYITDDPTLNELTFTVANNTGETLTFTGGEPVPEDTDTGSSCIYVFMDTLLFNQDIARIQLDTQSQQQWNLKHYSFDGDKAYLAISCIQDTSLNDKEVLEFKLTNIITQHKKVSSEIDVSQQRIAGFKPSRFKHPIPFRVTTPPDPQDKDLTEVLPVDFPGGKQVYIRDEGETFSSPPINCKLWNFRDRPLVSKESPWRRDKPFFKIRFLVAEKFVAGALTTPELAKNIIVNPEMDKSGKWKVVPDVSSPTPSWELQPQEDRNHEILGGREEITFIIDNIITRFKPGSALMYIDYFDIPGYRDGTYVFLLERVITKPVISFSVDKPSITLGEMVTLNWEATFCDSCTLYENNIKVGDYPTEKSLVLAPKNEVTIYKLVGHGIGSLGDISELKDVKVICPPQIDDFHSEDRGDGYITVVVKAKYCDQLELTLDNKPVKPVITKKQLTLEATYQFKPKDLRNKTKCSLHCKGKYGEKDEQISIATPPPNLVHVNAKFEYRSEWFKRRRYLSMTFSVLWATEYQIWCENMEQGSSYVVSQDDIKDSDFTTSIIMPCPESWGADIKLIILGYTSPPIEREIKTS